MHSPTEKTSKLEFPVLIGDIGGTNARFQIIEEPNKDPIQFSPVQTANYTSPIEAIEASVLSACPIKPKSALLAAAGPITPDGLDLTNCHWTILPNAFLKTGDIQSLVLMNDFEAQALSLPLLEESDGVTIGDDTAIAEDDATKAVLGPGTGLGVALLVRAAKKWIPVAGEGGHVDIGPRSKREQAIWEHLEPIEGRISAEQIICGNGLINLYNACCAADGVSPTLVDAPEISAAALAQNNDQASEGLELFCSTLGRVAGDLALISGAKGGVYIAGGIAQKILPFFKTSGFRKAFIDKAPHGALMQSIPTTIVTHPLPALLGLAAYASNPEAYGVDVDHRHWAR